MQNGDFSQKQFMDEHVKLSRELKIDMYIYILFKSESVKS